ncbi:unnamed protein product, partial [Allacma fusca]
MRVAVRNEPTTAMRMKDKGLPDICGSCLEKCPDFHQILYHVRKFHFKPGLRKPVLV